MSKIFWYMKLFFVLLQNCNVFKKAPLKKLLNFYKTVYKNPFKQCIKMIDMLHGSNNVLGRKGILMENV